VIKISLVNINLRSNFRICDKDFPGEHKFEVKFSKQSGKNKKWDYSNKLRKLFIDMNELVQVEFRIGSNPPGNLQIRTMPVYTEPSAKRETVKRCAHHSNPDDPTNKNFQQSALNHLIRYVNESTSYEEDSESGRLYALFDVGTPHQGTDVITRMIKFLCLGSCAGGINRRPIKVVFTLESQGRVVGRNCINVRICSCPKRDLQQEEQKYDNAEATAKSIADKFASGFPVPKKTQTIQLVPPGKKKKSSATFSMDSSKGNKDSRNQYDYLMLPVLRRDVDYVNGLVERSWVCEDPQNEENIKETRHNLIKEHNSDYAERSRHFNNGDRNKS